jgi:hypothetical protein
MLSAVTLALALILQLAQQPATPPPAAPSAPQTPPPAAAAPTADPANSEFATEAGLLLVQIKPALVADYELAIRTLQEALATTTDPQRQAVAKGWRVFKANEGDAKGNAVYVHVILPAVPGFDYRVSLLVDEMVKDLPPDLLSKYRDAFANPPTKLSLVDLANMAMTPVTPPAPTPAPVPKKPGV